MNGLSEHLMSKARDAKHGGHDAWAVQSTGERTAVALILNRADWLEEMGYTLAEAIERSGSEWVSQAAEIARHLEREEESV